MVALGGGLAWRRWVVVSQVMVSQVEMEFCRLEHCVRLPAVQRHPGCAVKAFSAVTPSATPAPPRAPRCLQPLWFLLPGGEIPATEPQIRSLRSRAKGSEVPAATPLQQGGRIPATEPPQIRSLRSTATGSGAAGATREEETPSPSRPSTARPAAAPRAARPHRPRPGPGAGTST